MRRSRRPYQGSPSVPSDLIVAPEETAQGGGRDVGGSDPMSQLGGQGGLQFTNPKLGG